MPKKDREAYNAYMREYMLRRYHRRRDEVVALLGGRCIACGAITDLDIDHIDSTKKWFTLGNRLVSAPLDVLKAELEGCQLLCSVCHIDKHRATDNFGKPRAVHGTVQMYLRYKCRCADCVKTAKVKFQEYKKRYKEKHHKTKIRQLRHGTLHTYYKHKCRCDLCTEAVNAYNTSRRDQRKVV